jgi:hypothetical protein
MEIYHNIMEPIDEQSIYVSIRHIDRERVAPAGVSPCQCLYRRRGGSTQIPGSRWASQLDLHPHHASEDESDRAREGCVVDLAASPREHRRPCSQGQEYQLGDRQSEVATLGL